MTVGDVTDYLMEHYYARYCPEQPVDKLSLATVLCENRNKIVVVHDGDSIKGVAVYLTLNDRTYKNLNNIDQTSTEVLRKLLKQRGKHIHFILVTAQGRSVILKGLELVKSKRPRSISWWNPTMTRLHRYSMN